MRNTLRAALLMATMASAVNPVTGNSLEIMGATELDATGDYGDATSRNGVNGNGWVAKMQVPYLIGQTFDPTKISIVVQDPGYNESGPTTVQRTIVGRKVLRRQYTANTLPQESNDGITLTVYFSLSDDVFAGTLLVSAAAAASWYGPSAPGAIPVLINSSSVSYPKPIGFFYNLQQSRVTGASFRVEWMAMSRWGMNSKMVPRVEFIAKDHLGNAASTQVATATELSQIQTNGNIGECYAADIPTSGLTQAVTDSDIGIVNIRAYPWIGDSTAVLDLEVDGYAWPTIRPLTPLRFVCDKNQTYGGAVAFVKSGAVGGAVGAVGQEATLRTTPFPDIEKAIEALPAWNNTNRGHNSHSGGTIYLMDDNGAGITHSIPATITAAVGSCWTEVKADPANVGVASWAPGANNRAVPGLIRWMARLDVTSAGYLDGGNSNANVMAAIDTCIANYTVTPGSPLFYRFGLGYVRNVQFTGSSGLPQQIINTFSTTRTQQQAIGCSSPKNLGTNSILKAWLLVGNDFHRSSFDDVNTTAVPNLDHHEGAIVYNNTLYGTRSLCQMGNTIAMTTWGAALVQNLVERAGTPSTACVGIGSDSTVVEFDKFIEMYMTTPDTTDGIGRTNRCYADVAGSENKLKRLISRFNLWGSVNNKRDTFTANTTSRGRVGGWRYAHHVGAEGNVSIRGSAAGTSPSDTSWLGEVWPPDSNYYALGGAGVAFVDNRVSTSGAGNGDYHLTGASNEAYSRVAAGRGALKYDITGALRKTDGTGACGAYERA